MTENFKKSIRLMAISNFVIWAMSIIALVFIIRHSPGAKGLFVILASGQSVSILLISNISKILN